MKWIDPSKTPPLASGHYWGIVVVVRPAVIVVEWDGEKWSARGFDDDDFMPFYYGSERLPDHPPIEDVVERVMNQVDKIVGRRR